MNTFYYKSLFLGKVYIDEVIKHGVLTVLKWIKKASVAEEFLKKTLIIASKMKKEVIISDVCNILRDGEHSFSHIEDWKNINIGEILHNKDENGKASIYFANQKRLVLGGLSLLYVEKQVHGDRDKALRCLSQNSGFDSIELWLIETYKLIHPPKESSRKLNAILLVVLQLLLSFFFLFWDWISDVLLCYQYMNIALNKENSTRDETEMSGKCAENDQMLTNQCKQTDAEVQSTYTTASLVMLITISLSTLAYIWTAINHSSGEWIKISESDNKVKSFINNFLYILSKIFWPITYITREYHIKVYTEETESNRDAVKESKTMWLFIRTLENGVTNYIQMLVQIYLMKPYVAFLTTLSFTEFLQLGIGSIFNFSDSLCDGKNVSIALGKLFLSIISLSYGASSRQASKQGITLGQTIKNFVLWISFFCLSLARIIALFSLMSLESPLPGLVSFQMIHLLLVFFILIKEEKGKCSVQKFFSRDTMRVIGSCFSCHTVVITFQNRQRGTPTFWTQLKFQSLIFCENVALAVLPLLAPPNLYPHEDCLNLSPKSVSLVLCLWLAGIIFQVNS